MQGDFDVRDFAVRARGVIDILPQSVVGNRRHRFIEHPSGQGEDDANRFISGKSHSQAVKQCRPCKGLLTKPGDYCLNLSQIVMRGVFIHISKITFSVNLVKVAEGNMGKDLY